MLILIFIFLIPNLPATLSPATWQKNLAAYQKKPNAALMVAKS
jgi:hypothetical protein